MTHPAEKDALTGTEGDEAIIAGTWRIIAGGTPAKWVTVRHESGATACVPWAFVASAARVFPPGGCGICGKPLSEVGTSRCYEAHGVIPPAKTEGDQ